MHSVVLNSKHHVDREASASSVVKRKYSNRREHREYAENTERILLRPLWLKNHKPLKASKNLHLIKYLYIVLLLLTLANHDTNNDRS